MGDWWEQSSFLGCISEKNVRCRQLGTLIGRCKCAKSWCDIDLTFDLVIVTLKFKILSRAVGFIFETVRCRKLIHGWDIFSAV